jgi:hypothetical protein
VIHDHELAVVVDDGVDLTDPVDVESGDEETWTTVFDFVVVVTKQELWFVGKVVLNVNVTYLNFKGAFDKGRAVVLEDGDRVVVLEGVVVFVDTGQSVSVGAPVHDDWVVDEVLSATLFGNEK